MEEGRDYVRMTKPIELFEWDFAGSDLDDLTAARTSAPLPVRFIASGVMNAFLVYFTLDLDGSPANAYGSGTDYPGSHWEQNARWLPQEMRVAKGDRARLVATHSDHHLATLRLVDLSPRAFDGMVGHAHMVGLPQAQDCVVALDFKL